MPRIVAKYNPVHAIAASILLVAAVSRNFWHLFIHGNGHCTPPPDKLASAVLSQILLFGAIALVMWISTLFIGRRDTEKPSPPMMRAKALRFTLLWFPAICIATFAVEWVSVTTLDKFLGIKLPPQDLIEWLKPSTYPLWTRLLLMATALFEAPLFEEPLFRGIIFRGFAAAMPPWIALVISSFIFSLVHVNAATLVPIWFLGGAFAWLYWRTGTILAPMCAHFLFNLVNLLLLLFFPSLAN